MLDDSIPIMGRMRVHAILLAGGAGDRFGAEIPKQFVRLAGEPILLRSIRTVAAAGIDELVIVSHPDWIAETERELTAAHLSIPACVVAGGMTRNESTRNALLALDAAPDDVVLVHDAVRPLVPLDVVRRSIAPVADGTADATDTVILSADTLVIVERGEVIEIPERARYRRGQTPQVFRMSVLARAYEAATAAGDLTATDDCSLVLRYVPGARILAVPGDEVNLKITTGIDLVMADRMLQMRTLSHADVPAVSGLDGARILVVGGTNGIGRAIAEEAGRLGARAVVEGRSTGLDVRDADAVDARVAKAATDLGGLDHVVVTAGILRLGAVADSEPGALAEVIDVNLTGTLNVARAAFRHLLVGGGSFTAFASSSFTRGRPDYVAYSASKAGVVNLVEGLADEWAPFGVRANVVSPERTDTPMRSRAFPDESREGLLAAVDVARATLRLLASDLTGQVLDVRRHDTAVPAGLADPADADPDGRG
jgi:ribitol-5-phosphate 2-dehydrogenase (NADP+) / D-ribitol-5-phosphate cytidylyltransferase